jgi:hypothetical protein
MPLVLLQYRHERGLEEIAQKLAQELPNIVSRALDVPGNNDERLNPVDIEVRVYESGKYFVNAQDLEMTIIAHDYPERTENIEARKDVILDGVRKLLAYYDRNVSGWVWVLPQQNTAFGKI